MSQLQQQFEEMVEFLSSGTSGIKASNQFKLKMYGLYKQATQGDATGKPSKLDMVATAKFMSWQKLSGMSAVDAMQNYIDEVTTLKLKV